MESGSIFNRTTLLIGQEMQQKLGAARVILFGVGGVGSWCAESLVRSGVRTLTIVDSDTVCSTNINRQLPATTQTVGEAKVDVLKNRLQEINPQVDIYAIRQFYQADTAESFCLESYDYIIDAIDSLESKLHLICAATQTKAVFFSSMGAALKMDPSRIKVAAFWKVNGCPLAAALRRKMKRNKQFPAKKFYCVFSDELLENKGYLESPVMMINDQTTKRVNGTIVHITAIFGFTLASLVVRDICS